MKNGLSSSTKWWIALVALLALVMGINGAASARRASVVDTNGAMFADTLLLQDNINTFGLLQATATPAAQQTPEATPAATQAAQPTAAPAQGTGQQPAQDTGIDLANLPNGWFQYTGIMGARDASGLTVSNQKFETSAGFQEDSTIQRGEQVIVTGIVRGDGRLVAQSVERIGAQSETNPFLFTGTVNNIDGENWIIAGTRVRVPDSLTANSNIRKGSRVSVSGNSNGGGSSWVADSIAVLPRGDNQDNSNDFFMFSGKVNGSSPWSIAGREVNISDDMLPITPTLRVGDVISVNGIVSGGNWRASQVQHMGRPQGLLFLIGVIEDDDPLTVRGLQFNMNDASLTTGETFNRGDRVQILATGREGGAWAITRMGRVDYDNDTKANFAGLLNAEGKVTICHLPGGTAGNAYTIEVSVAKARMHIAEHGDTVGACED
jgi:hypothetical protein